MTRPYRLLVSCALLASCFEPPRLEPRDAARLDGARAEVIDDRPLRVVSVGALDARGVPWPLDAAPRTVTFVVETSLALALGADAPVFLISGEPDDSLATDVARAPLTASTRERVIASEAHADGPRMRLSSVAPFAPGVVATVVVAGWAETREGRRMDAASLTRLEISADPAAGAAVIASFPADGTPSIPTNAASIALALDGEVTLVGEPLRALLDGTGAAGAVTLPRCSALGMPGVSCLMWAPSRPLAAGGQLVIETTDALRDATGAVVPRSITRLRVAAAADETPPRIEAASECPLDAVPTELGCVIATDTTWSLEVHIDEPVRVELTIPGRVLRALAPRGTAELVAFDLAPGLSAMGTLTAVDLAGLRASVPVAIATHADLPGLTITEICADPEGPEPAQEWIEIANVGSVPVSLDGIAISDREHELGTVLASAGVLAAGARAVIASETFDSDAAGLPPGAPLVTTGRALVSGGISNAGEALFLRDAGGRRLARVPPLAGREGECVVRRSGAEPRADAPEDFHYDACSPGS